MKIVAADPAVYAPPLGKPLHVWRMRYNGMVTHDNNAATAFVDDNHRQRDNSFTMKRHAYAMMMSVSTMREVNRIAEAATMNVDAIECQWIYCLLRCCSLPLYEATIRGSSP